MSCGLLSVSSAKIFSKSNALLVIGFAVGFPTGAGIGPFPTDLKALFLPSSRMKPPHLLESNLLSANAKFAKNDPMKGRADLTKVTRM